MGGARGLQIDVRIRGGVPTTPLDRESPACAMNEGSAVGSDLSAGSLLPDWPLHQKYAYPRPRIQFPNLSFSGSSTPWGVNAAAERQPEKREKDAKRKKN
ncbi:hypothetical protein AVEN_81349-1 [Araneus ventricosus]|uniref:Uncharacterized protein n=1 Tax=Araneus ventricosus TaxID=182803 RepID=A0A4Y2B6V6_ARAVE|nr:hypothetical protein AVEN_81349-1 [Araneus ventricosus]